MAKKKKSGGSSVGLIVTLIFFVLTTFTAGGFAYSIYSDQQQFVDAAATAKKEKDAALQQLRVEQSKTVVYKIAIGADTGEDRVRLIQGMLDEESRLAIKREHEILAEKFRTPLLPKDDDFEWKLIAMDPSKIRETKGAYSPENAKDDRDVAPKRLFTEIIREYKNARDAAAAEQKKAELLAAQNKKMAEAATANRGTAEADFKKAVEEIKADVEKTKGANQVAFEDLKKDTAAKGKKLEDNLIKYNKAQGILESEKDELAKKLDDVQKKLAKLDQQNNPQVSAIGPDLIAQDEKKGEILSKDSSLTRSVVPNPGPFSTLEGGTKNETKGTFVTINIGSSQKLKPGITFAVLPAGASWRSTEEKERLIKGQIEVVEILTPFTSRAKVIDEKEPLRDPIQAKDQLYNLGWNPDEEIRVAFGGLIDLDGDGIDNNDDFLRLLERQGVIVDEYLKLKPLEFVKRDQRGMTLKTRFLIIAPDPRLEEGGAPNTPQRAQMELVIAKMGEMKLRAKELGIQLIEARKFLALIGVKPPRNPVPPAYGAAVYLDQAPPMPKKDAQ